ncbi:cyclase [Phormidesmis priestleyi ULC007]|uniref:Cyclase n=1 Tax=Phormidesmis priestleyi ULC007 TaxID=1920490 RepID=A0A2T1DFH3_9CYAN|nr:SRPBCC family protein [Phormidesmis priestleyi]PSB19248.1 cyclase [Phormidesmis priestleyi ULC007]PZO48203.1 MAG: cyclase [Phormidesmis priestleyi]
MMTASTKPNLLQESTEISFTIPEIRAAQRDSLLNGEILLKTRSYTAWGGAVTAQMYLPVSPAQVWQQLTDYPRWTLFFPDITRSEVVHNGISGSSTVLKRQVKRIYQKASKAFLFLTAQVEIHLKVLETQHQRIQFYLESGSFRDFSADLQLQACGDGTILTYSVQATPTIPIPGVLIEQAIQFDLPTNLKQMRRVICGK